MKPSFTAKLAVTGLIFSYFAVSAAADELYQVGVAAVDITPDYPIRLHGFASRKAESDGITQRIWAKALAIGSDEDHPAILFTVDNLGTRLPILDEVATRLKKKAGIERNHIALTFTHSHTTPKTVGSADTIFGGPIPPEHQARIDRYTAELTDALERAALEALANRQLARLEWAVGKVGFAKNRRPSGGPVDHSLPMLVVKSPDGEIRAVYVTYACHCVTLSDNKISGDWAGYAQEIIQRRHPGAIALVSIGCGSDSNPSSGVTGDNTAAAVEQGGEIADEVDRLLRGALKSLSGKIAATLDNVELPLNRLPSRDELVKTAKKDDPAGYNAKFQLAKLDRGEELLSAIEYPIQTITFGDSLAIVFLAGEVCVDYSLRLNKELDSARIWLHGYSNDFCAYIPSERLVREGGYGGGAETVYFALPATLQAGLEDKIVAEVRRQLPAEFLNSNLPRSANRFQPSTPKEAVQAIQLGNGFIAELMASEPLVVDPVAIDFGADGSLWVAEMRDYARGVAEEFEQQGSIRKLEDTDDDGKFDKSTVFQSGLRFPTDVKVWRKGVIVCDAPEVIYFEDTNGDGKADIRKVLLTGFETHNAQARVNSLRWGLDNWLYGSCGLYGGAIKTSSGQEIKLGGCDFRFKPDTGEIEAAAGRSQQGRTRDDWGNWFGCENGVLGKHYPLADHYLARHSFVIAPHTERRLVEGLNSNRLFPIGEQVLFQLSGPPGLPTAACGLEVYRDELLGAQFHGNTFTAEPVNQLIHRRVLSSDGVTFRGARATEESDRDFLASTDQWFRPVQVRTGLDGGLWIVDMCRYVIEHPRFIPEETLRTLDVQAGNKAGRIYRVRPRDMVPRTPKRLRSLDTASLAAELDSPNGPYRDLVHELLLERGDPTAIRPLELLVKNANRPATRLQALCVLDGMSALNEQLVLTGLNDSAPGVRRHAIRLSEPFLDTSAGIWIQILKLVDDADPQIQLQLAYTLGESHNSQAGRALAELAWKHRSDTFIQAAVLSSLDPQKSSELLRHLRQRIAATELPQPLRATCVTAMLKLGGFSQIREFLLGTNRVAGGPIALHQLALLTEVLEGTDPKVCEQLEADSECAEALGRIASAAQQILGDTDQPDESKLVALRMLSATHLAANDLTSQVSELLNVRSSPAIQHAAVELLASSSSPVAGELLLEKWSAFTPDTRARAIGAMISRPPLVAKLIEGIQSGAINRSELDALQRQQLLRHSDERIRADAANALAGAIDADRQKIIDAFASVATLSGDGARGRELFRKHCASCHRLEEHGFSIGPDLAALSNRSTGAMLEAIFDPNRAVEERYQSYAAVTDEGQVFTGVLSGERENSVTLLEPGGKKQTLLRTELEDFRNTRVSLMPEGFEKDLTAADVADLVSYVASQGQPPKQFPGNQPKLIKPRADGSLALLATDCEIHGPSIVFEASFKNVGYWHSKDDRVIWSVKVPKAGDYDVYLDASCADYSQGKIAVVEGFRMVIETTIPGTGGWDEYRQIHIGQAHLAAGQSNIVVRTGTVEMKDALMDLRGVYLVRVGQPLRVEAPSQEQAKAPDAASEIAELLSGLDVGTPAEYERVPAIWSSAIAAGKRNNDHELLRLIELSIPQVNEPARNWQVVVVGGGVINGLSQVGIWPRQRIGELLRDNEPLRQRWERLIDLSSAMADDTSVREGTRYDALRILGVDTFERRGAQLVRYLQAGVSEELQMGAVSGLVDIECEAATQALVANFAHYYPGNRELAIAGLTRSENRLDTLLKALKEGTIRREAVSDASIGRLRQIANPELRELFEKQFDILGESPP